MMNTTWELNGDEIIIAGTVEVGQQRMRVIPWKIVYSPLASNEEDIFDETAITRKKREDYPDYPDQESVSGWPSLLGKIRFECKVAKSQFIVINAHLTPETITADLTTPYNAAKSASISLDLSSTETSTIVTGQAMLNEDALAFNANVSFPTPESIIPDIMVSITTPYTNYKDIAFLHKIRWKENGVDYSFSFIVDERTIQVDADAVFVAWEQAGFNLKLTVPTFSHPISVKFQLKGDDGGGSLKIFLQSPNNKIDFQGTLVLDFQLYRVSLSLDSELLTGKLDANLVGNDGIWKMELLLETDPSLRIFLSSNTDDNYNNVELSAAARYKEHFDYSLNSTIVQDRFSNVSGKIDFVSRSEQVIDNDWKLDFSIDFVDIDKYYGHNLLIKSLLYDRQYHCYAQVVGLNSQRQGKVGISWSPSGKPLEINFTGQTLAPRTGKIVASITSPWFTEETAIVNVDVDAKDETRTIVRLALEAAESIKTNIDVELNLRQDFIPHTVNMSGN